MRLSWRLGLDWQWYKEPRAKKTLQQFSLLSKEWKTKNKLFSSYSHDGLILNNTEAPATYGGSLAYFLIHDISSAQEIYTSKIKPTTSSNTIGQGTLSYYDNNWVWFGIGIYNQNLSNLTN